MRFKTFKRKCLGLSSQLSIMSGSIAGCETSQGYCSFHYPGDSKCLARGPARENDSIWGDVVSFCVRYSLPGKLHFVR